MRGDRKRSKVVRLNRIAGQLQGVRRRSLLYRIQEVKAALGRADSENLRDHAAHCVADALRSGDVSEQQQKVDELVELFDRARP
ncbi:metal-sensing transcriptional repressor [Rhizobium sp. IBUN]|uniref:metal-sensing transcriptional repressor n=1 Tax=Rhizobium sp. IBUN TaxID=1042326 RepID=UPI00046F86B7|nr:metal-sensing transcriptional repressor [Rhizobium sp. IBUN]